MVARFTLALLILVPVASGSGDPASGRADDAARDEARRILEEAFAASLEIDRVGYSATRYTLRTDGDSSGGLEVPLFAEVRMRDVEGGELGVQFVARGSFYSAGGPDRARGFVAACDGRTAELLNAGATTPESRTGDVRGFLGPLLTLVPAEFIDGGPLEQALRAPEAHFEGLALVSGQPCEVVRVRDDAQTTTRYFVATSDRVVRRLERERAGALEVLTIAGLTLHPRWGDEAFVLPSGTPLAAPVRQDDRPLTRLPTGSPAPSFELRDDRGRTVRLGDLRGEVVVLAFWAPWSEDCVAAISTLQRLHADFAARGVRLFGVTVLPRADQPDPVELLRERGAAYPVLLEADGLRADYAVSGVPALYVVDRGGEILWASAGFDASGAEERRLRAVISAALR